MARNPVARIGDTSSHGGGIITSGQALIERAKVARVSDLLDCPIHGVNPILTGSPFLTETGQRVARTGSVTACGAVITGGAIETFCE